MEALRAARDWEALSDLEVAAWVDGVGQLAGRAPAPVRELVRRMCLETYLQEKPEGRPIALDPPAAGRLGELRVPMQVIIGELDTLGARMTAGLLANRVAGARRIDVPGVAHLPSMERPAWFTETLPGSLAEVG